MAKATFIDVNKEKYLKALFRDVQKQTKMIDFENESKNAKIIHDFVVGNATNGDKKNSKLKKRNGRFVISKSSYTK